MTARVLAAAVTALGLIATACLLSELRLTLWSVLEGRADTGLALVIPFLVLLGTFLAPHLGWAGFAGFAGAGLMMVLYLFEEGLGLASGLAALLVAVCLALCVALAKAQDTGGD